MLGLMMINFADGVTGERGEAIREFGETEFASVGLGEKMLLLA